MEAKIKKVQKTTKLLFSDSLICFSNTAAYTCSVFPEVTKAYFGYSRARSSSYW